MPPILLFFIAVLTPFLLIAALIGPTYGAIVGVCYIIYQPAQGLHPLADKWFDFFTMLDVYQNLFANWLGRMAELSLVNYTLPLIFLPLIAVIATVFLMKYLVKRLIDIFYIPVGDKH